METYDSTIYREILGARKELLHDYTRHQRTCPECGRTLVNVYFVNPVSRLNWPSGWRCMKCWKKLIQGGTPHE